MRNNTRTRTVTEQIGYSTVLSKALVSAGFVLKLTAIHGLAFITTMASCPGRDASFRMPALKGLAELGCTGLMSKDQYAGSNHTQTDAVI